VTVINQGTADAGQFALVFNGFPMITVPSLAAGQSVVLTYTSGCSGGTHTVVVDALSQVVESDETNNTATIDVIC
jgi:subtilase family serine protease